MNRRGDILRLFDKVEERELAGDTEGAREAYGELTRYLCLHVGAPIIGRMFHMRDLRKKAAVNADLDRGKK